MTPMRNRGEALRRLAAELPNDPREPEDVMRACLSVILVDTPTLEPQPKNFGSCPNCGKPESSPRTPYCSEECRLTAAFVRQFRAATANGSIFERDKQIRLGQALWSLQGGGYPLRQMLIPEKTLAQVLTRSGGVCYVCGGPASEVDHVGSG